MKAKEYYEKYKESLLSSDEDVARKAVKSLMDDLIDETLELSKKRNVKSIEGTVAISNELNQKWNAIGNLFQKHDGVLLLKENGYKDFMLSESFALKQMYEHKQRLDEVRARSGFVKPNRY